MLRLFAIGLLLIATTSLAEAQDSYAIQTVTAAQEALVRLGYEVGGIDGKWGKKARTAMNDLREKNGLPPAQDFVGSSLALVHRLSPGTTTLPNPGVLITDPVERRTFLASPTNYYKALNEWCPAKVDEVITLSELVEEDPVAVVVDAVGQRTYLPKEEDWYTPIMQTLIAGHDLCMVGDDQSCRDIIGLMSKWANADALRPGHKRSNQGWVNSSWIANSLLRNFVFAYADARKLTEVDPVVDAAVLDWFKRRIDQYHFIKPSGKTPGAVDYTEAGNHSLAHMMAAMAFGVLVGDRSMTNEAWKYWRIALESMRSDGSLPLETRRGARSLQYTNFQVAQLISTAEVARAQGIDLYGQAPPDKSIPKAVRFILDAYENFEVVRDYASVNHGSPSNDFSIPYIIQMHWGWLPTYFARFGEDENIKRMRSLTIDARICSPGALAETKMSRSDRVCAGNKGEPVPLVKMLELGGGKVGQSPNNFMGYPAQCLQGVTPSWPVMP